jgi:hypothetical protein
MHSPPVKPLKMLAILLNNSLLPDDTLTAAKLELIRIAESRLGYSGIPAKETKERDEVTRL